MILLAALVAQSPAAQTEIVPVGQEQFEVAVPRSQLRLDSYDTSPPPAVGRVALSFNNWAPQNLTPSSLIPDASELKSTRFPGFTLALGLGQGWKNTVTLRPVLSLSYRNFERIGSLESTSFRRPIRTSAPIFSAGAGLEVGFPPEMSPRIRPYLGMMMRSHALVFSTSAFDFGGTRWGYSGQASLGIEWIPWGENSLGFDVAATGDLGQIDNEQLQAWGVQGGMRWTF
jgi:hypothetical protein